MTPATTTYKQKRISSAWAAISLAVRDVTEHPSMSVKDIQGLAQQYGAQITTKEDIEAMLKTINLDVLGTVIEQARVRVASSH